MGESSRSAHRTRSRDKSAQGTCTMAIGLLSVWQRDSARAASEKCSLGCFAGERDEKSANPWAGSLICSVEGDWRGCREKPGARRANCGECCKPMQLEPKAWARNVTLTLSAYLCRKASDLNNRPRCSDCRKKGDPEREAVEEQEEKLIRNPRAEILELQAAAQLSREVFCCRRMLRSKRNHVRAS